MGCSADLLRATIRIACLHVHKLHVCMYMNMGFHVCNGEHNCTDGMDNKAWVLIHTWHLSKLIVWCYSLGLDGQKLTCVTYTG